MSKAEPLGSDSIAACSSGFNARLAMLTSESPPTVLKTEVVVGSASLGSNRSGILKSSLDKDPACLRNRRSQFYNL